MLRSRILGRRRLLRLPRRAHLFRRPQSPAQRHRRPAQAHPAELDEARRLKEEAQALLAQYQRKQREAEQEAAAIIAGAKAEAERLASEAKAKIEDFVARRTKMAETKIAQAEAQALADVRAAAADAAVAAAERVLRRHGQGQGRRRICSPRASRAWARNCASTAAQ